jgi:hypothetical protein
MAFAKIFELETGQVLAKLDAHEGEPELRWYAQPPELGVCSIAISFKNTDEGWDLAEKAFADANEATARAAMASILSAVAG